MGGKKVRQMEWQDFFFGGPPQKTPPCWAFSERKCCLANIMLTALACFSAPVILLLSARKPKVMMGRCTFFVGFKEINRYERSESKV